MTCARSVNCLIKRKLIRLAEEAVSAHEDSKVEVRGQFVAKIMSLKKTSGASYHDDKCLADITMASVDISFIGVVRKD